MDVVLPTPGTYVLAVSGGVDSVTLLHLLAQHHGQSQSNASSKAGYLKTKFIVAHFDHGIRPDSRDDRLFVQQLAAKYRLPFVFSEEQLGPGASEATARTARYRFLEKVRRTSAAQAIVTAHHEDDVLETAILNLLRGTGRKGLTSLSSDQQLYRPLLGFTKRDLIAYAQDQGLTWHEDSTNTDQAYRRNYVRQVILPRFSSLQRQQLNAIVAQQRHINQELDTMLINLLHIQSKAGMLDRSWFIQLPYALSKEILALWLRMHNISDFDRKTLGRLAIAAKVSPNNRLIDIVGGNYMIITSHNLALKGPER